MRDAWIDRSLRHQVMFGSDNPRFEQIRMAHAIDDLELRESTIELIKGANALEFLNGMLWTDKMFGTKKPIISMLHLDPLPGDPRYGHGGGTVSTVVEHAKRDLDALQEGGIDGIIVSNEFSLPYQRHMDYVTPATMAMDKIVTKRMMDAAGIRTPKWRMAEYGETDVAALAEELTMP